uniref:Serpentine receptor class gamma n=1 Tax=Caenorhabditis tropicalis TaxID=1561998 RepID=A0A1I7UW64_9PELO
MNNETIHGKSDYLNYEFDLFTLPVLFAAIPILYILPTICVVIRIIRVYIDHVFMKKDEIINPHVFSVIVLQFVISFIYILADYSTIRLPSTGILTSWCSSQQPNHGLKILYFLSVYLNYIALLFPFLLSILRSLPVFYPIRVSELCARIVRIGTPIMFIYPFLFCFPLFPALGDCRQLLGSYPFGSIYIYWSQSLFDAVAIFHPSSSVYLVAIRPYGNDCDFVLVPWIFYSTHPIFKIEKTESNGTARRVLTL